jgi:hypothetical protein
MTRTNRDENTKGNTKRSAAYRLLELVWKNVCACTGHSWERINHSMAAALALAIRSGMRFGREDFARFAVDFNSGFWILNDGGHMYGEGIYRLALYCDNLSAARSFEAWKKRPPYIVDRIFGDAYRSGRIALRSKFIWQEKTVTVTSFADDGQSIVACAYDKKFENGRLNEKLTRRFRITYDAFREEMSRRRKENKSQ